MFYMKSICISSVFTFLILHTLPGNCKELAQWNTVAELRNSLLKGYDRKIRPVIDHNHNTTVELAISIKGLDLDDKKQRLSVVSWLFVVWSDEHLIWDPQSHGNLENLTFDHDEIWTPDVALYNSADGSGSVKTNMPLLVHRTGVVVQGSPFVAVIPCQLDLYYWPTDEHTCTLEFGSWSHYGEQIDLNLAKWVNDSVILDHYHNNSKWLLLNHSSSREVTRDGAETYLQVDFKVVIKRSTPAHAVYLANTTVAVMILVLAAYILPLNYHLSRIVLHLFSLGILVTCNFGLYITLPATAGRVPHIVKFYSGSTILTIMSLLCTIVMTTLLTSSYGPRKGFRRKLASIWSGGATDTQPSADISGEVPYGILGEDTADNGDAQMEVEEPSEIRMTKGESLMVQSLYGSTVIFRIVNGVFFALYFLAYLIDYTVLRKTIYAN